MTQDSGGVSISNTLPPPSHHIPPLLPYILAYISGLCGAFPVTRFFIVPFALPMGLFIIALFLTQQESRRAVRKTVFVLLLAGFGYLAPALPDLTRPSNHILNHIQEGQTTTVEGKLLSPPRVLKDRTYYRVELESIGTPAIAVTGTLRVSIYKPHSVLKIGDQVRFNKIRLKVPRNFKNPGRFDYHLYLKSKGIDITGNVSRIETIETTGRFALPFWHTGLHGLRSQLYESLDRLFTGDQGALLKAMVLGVKDSLSTEVRENYIATGLAHLMAVSGLHIGFIAAAFYLILWPIVFYLLYRLKPDSARAGHARKVTAILCLIPVLIYMSVVGLKVSSLRAGIMVSALLIAVLIDRRSSLINAFLTAGFLILLWKPESILDIGFQLSFLAVGGILLVFTKLSEINNDPIARMGELTWSQKLLQGRSSNLVHQESLLQAIKSRFEKIILAGAVVSFTVTAVTLPVLIYQFNRVSLVGVFLNILMVPLASILIPTVLFMIWVGTFSIALPSLIKWPVTELTQLFLSVPKFFANHSYSSIYVSTPPSTWLVFYFCAIFTGLLILLARAQNTQVETLIKNGFIISTLCALVLFYWPRVFQFPGEKLIINVLDVGQGESILIEFPNGETLVMDGGGFYKNRLDVGKRIVAPFLWNRGLKKIDYMVATHSDNDHIRGLYSLLNLFPVKNFLTLGENFSGQRLQRLQNNARAKGSEFSELKLNTPLRIGEVTLIPLHPASKSDQPTRSKRRVDNDLSLVLRLEYRNFNMLFTGDISEKIETGLIGSSLRADILKGPHHGSRYSNSQNFINAVSPDAVVFSSGYLNRMRHPHPETIERYQSSGTNIYRTDRQGAIQIITNGNNYKIHTHEHL